MAEKHGVKETKEALMAVMLVGAFVTERLKDGVDLSDLGAMLEKLKDDEFKNIVDAGIKGSDQIGEEIGDLSLAEGLELASALIPELLTMLMKKDA